MVVPIAASGQAIYNIAPQSDIGGVQQVVLGKKAQEIVKSPKDFEKLKIGIRDLSSTNTKSAPATTERKSMTATDESRQPTRGN